MRRTIFLTLIISVCAVNASMAALVQWKVEDGGNGHYYEAISVSGLTFDDARVSAELRDGYVVTITSQAEQDFISSHVISDGFGYRIGGFQPIGSPEPDGGWEWVTGEKFDYTNWYSGEPNNQFGIEDTLVMWASNQWNDGPGSYQNYNGYILEMEMIPQPATILILGLGAAMARNRM